MPTNDNEPAIRVAPTASTPITLPDAHGLAALLLVESLIHGLCEKAMLSADEACEIAERAMSVQRDQAEAADGAGTTMWQSHALLSSIAASLGIDGDGGASPHGDR